MAANSGFNYYSGHLSISRSPIDNCVAAPRVKLIAAVVQEAPAGDTARNNNNDRRVPGLPRTSLAIARVINFPNDNNVGPPIIYRSYRPMTFQTIHDIYVTVDYRVAYTIVMKI